MAADFEGTVRHMKDKGATFCKLAGEQGKEHTRADGVRSIYLQDPDEYWIEVNKDF